MKPHDAYGARMCADSSRPRLDDAAYSLLAKEHPKDLVQGGLDRICWAAAEGHLFPQCLLACATEDAREIVRLDDMLPELRSAVGALESCLDHLWTHRHEGVSPAIISQTGPAACMELAARELIGGFERTIAEARSKLFWNGPDYGPVAPGQLNIRNATIMPCKWLIVDHALPRCIFYCVSGTNQEVDWLAPDIDELRDQLKAVEVCISEVERRQWDDFDGEHPREAVLEGASLLLTELTALVDGIEAVHLSVRTPETFIRTMDRRMYR